MNRVGRQGRGESVWLGFFLHGILGSFAALCAGARRRGARRRATAARRGASPPRSSRAGTASGTAAATTTTARRSAPPTATSAGSTRSRRAGRCCPERCPCASPIAPWTRCAPTSCGATSASSCCSRRPSTARAQDPGYIRGYPPGVRENGGQYTHAAVWVVMAMAKLGSGDEAVELFHMLNPINHARTAGGRRALQGRALRAGRRRLRPPGARRARRLDLVHRLGGLALPRRAREHPRAAAARRDVRASTRASRRRGRASRCAGASARSALRDRGREPASAAAAAWPSASSTARRSTRARSRSSTTAASTRFGRCSGSDPRSRRSPRRSG